jgi:cytochrome c oxidase subunit I+III
MAKTTAVGSRATKSKTEKKKAVRKKAVSPALPFPERIGTLHDVWRSQAGLAGWLSAINHKTIGRRYIVTGFMFFVLAGINALLMRIQLMYPENTFLNADQYNRLFTVHGVTMMFLFAVPIMLGVGIYFVPLMVGARDVPFPRLNAFGYYTYLFAGVVLWLSLFVGTGPDGGWFAYPPLTESRYSPSYGMDVWTALITGTEIAALVAASEIILTVFKFRAPGLSLNRIPVFVWAMLVTSVMVIFAMPTLVIASTELMMDRGLNTNFFNVELGGNPLLWQHLFWFFAHPEVYIIFIPGLGMVSEILAAFSRRAVVGYAFLVISLVSISVISFGLWVHHMFTTGLPNLSLSFFTIASMVISIPSGIQIFSGLATLWHGNLNLKTPLLYVLGFIFTFIIGGFSGVMIASVPFDMQAHDSYFIVAHFHYVLIGGAVFPLLGAMYYWFPKITGRMMNERMGQWNFWLTIIGFHITFFPMHLMGLYGMPRRVYTYLPGLGWDGLNFISTIGAFLTGLGVLLFVLNVFNSLRNGEPAPDNPWGAGGLEWATTSPPQPYNFHALPVVQSRYPVWDAPAGGLSFYQFEENPERRETLGTSALDAEPEMRVILPGDSMIPFLTAVAVTAVLISAMFDDVPVVIFSLVSLGLLALWHWPRGKEWSMDWVNEGPEGSLSVSTIVKDKKPPMYYGILLFIVIEATEFVALIASYFYIRSYTADWPPGDTPMPDLLIPTIATALLLISVIPTYLGDQAIKKGNQRRLIINLIITIILELVFIALMLVNLQAVNYNWDQNAYASLYWVLIGTHLAFAAVMVLENAYVLVLALRGFYNSERHWGVEIDGMSSYFVAAAWIAVYLTVFISPYLM